jgi:hypothetical protein
MTAVAGGVVRTNRYAANQKTAATGVPVGSFGTGAASFTSPTGDARMPGLGKFRGQRTWLDFGGLHYDWVTEPAAPPPTFNNDNFFLVL